MRILDKNYFLKLILSFFLSVCACVYEKERQRGREIETSIHHMHAEVKVWVSVLLWCSSENLNLNQACTACLLLTEFSPWPLVELFTIE